MCVLGPQSLRAIDQYYFLHNYCVELHRFWCERGEPLPKTLEKNLVSMRDNIITLHCSNKIPNAFTELCVQGTQIERSQYKTPFMIRMAMGNW